VISLKIHRYGNNLTNDVLDNCDHAEFVFSSGYIANCHSNGTYMITDFYHKITKNNLYATAYKHKFVFPGQSKSNSVAWKNKSFIDDEMITSIIDYYHPDELVDVNETLSVTI